MPPKTVAAIARVSSNYKATARAKFAVGFGFVVLATLVAQIIVTKKVAKKDAFKVAFEKYNKERHNDSAWVAFVTTYAAGAFWALGLKLLTDALGTISLRVRNRAWGIGLLVANVVMLSLVVVPPNHWSSYFLRTLWAFYGGVAGEIFYDLAAFMED